MASDLESIPDFGDLMREYYKNRRKHPKKKIDEVLGIPLVVQTVSVAKSRFKDGSGLNSHIVARFASDEENSLFCFSTGSSIVAEQLRGVYCAMNNGKTNDFFRMSSPFRCVIRKVEGKFYKIFSSEKEMEASKEES